ncbi:DUF5753 domain-containing protein [Actinomadura sp. NEAU-AAG7]|uniref:DUF5753 domain-containing protein n=1 Tax=Actinomadura sp. NEAU-AAG7 TaxID=2839640 RepID=UPI001BE436BE|nr:DUF5753 domain-containing protein [Actinomadura sp. NEAU-AAG7]MBT2206865.1 helix-turn-helix domain-containing protein [Actinomadura sp. NEAU-AAG7]
MAAGPAAHARGPTVRRMLLGARLRRLRELKGLSREEAGYAIRGSHSKISRMELGRTAVKERDIADLLVLYGVTDDAERRNLLRLAREANARGWWHRYSDMIPSWTHPYLDLEEAAGSVRTYDPCQIPELLQTEEYARASLAIRDGIREGMPPIEIEGRISVRLMRQRMFARSRRRTLAAIVEEAALRRFVGGPELIRGQLRHLSRVSEAATVDLRIIPADRASLAPTGRAFTVLRFDEQAIPDVVYVELLTTALYLDKPADTHAFERVWNRLEREALSPDASRALLSRLMEHLAE